MPNSFRFNVLSFFILIALTCALYYPTLSYNYVFWDDAFLIFDNEQIRQDITIGNLLAIFQVQKSPTYQPVRNFFWIFAYNLGKFHPFPYHLLNLFFYSLNGVGVFFLTKELFIYLRRPIPLNPSWAALLASLLFVVHPLHVEVVSWIADLKDLLAGSCYFLAAMYYLRHKRSSELKYYGLCVLFFYVGLLSKPSVAAFPVLILFLDIFLFRTRFLYKREFLAHLPFWVPVTLAAYFFLFLSEIPKAEENSGLSARALSAAVVMKEYLELLLFPFPSVLCHGYANKIIESAIDPRAIASIGILLGFMALLFFLRKKNFLISFAVFWHLLNLLPTSNLIPIGIMKADRYVFISSYGWTIFFFLFFFTLAGRCWKGGKARSAATALAAGVMIISVLFSICSRERMTVWKDDISLWEDGFRKSKAITVLSGLAYVYFKRGRIEEAITLYRERYQATGDIRLYYGLGGLLMDSGRTGEAREVYLEAMGKWKDDHKLNFWAGVSYLKERRLDEAERHLKKARGIEPLDINTTMALAETYLVQGKRNSAVEVYSEFISKKPDPAILNNLGALYLEMGLSGKAKMCFELSLMQKWDPRVESNLKSAGLDQLN